MVFFSFIIPVYNVKKYLSECIESILKQPFNDYEIILIDDGSTDGSAEICDFYTLKHSDKISTIHKKNGGLSDARNLGIQKASGKFLVFIDSDDYIMVDSLNALYKKLSKKPNTDILITRLIEEYPDGVRRHMDENMPIDNLNIGSKNLIVDWLFNKSQNTWPAQRYIVSNKFVKQNNLKFKKGFLHEDIDWTMKLFLNANRFLLIGNYWYIHRKQREGSITTQPNVKRVLDVIELASSNLSDESYNKLDSNIRGIMYRRLVHSVYSSISKYSIYHSMDRRKIIESLKQNRKILRHSTNFRHMVFYLFTNIFGLRLGLSLIRFFN